MDGGSDRSAKNGDDLRRHLYRGRGHLPYATKVHPAHG
jgi:hypothetical protein